MPDQYISMDCKSNVLCFSLSCSYVISNVGQVYGGLWKHNESFSDCTVELTGYSAAVFRHHSSYSTASSASFTVKNIHVTVTTKSPIKLSALDTQLLFFFLSFFSHTVICPFSLLCWSKSLSAAQAASLSFINEHKFCPLTFGEWNKEMKTA